MSQQRQEPEMSPEEHSPPSGGTQSSTTLVWDDTEREWRTVEPASPAVDAAPDRD